MARLAAKNMPSVTREALQTRAPRPTPGKMYMLLHWEAWRACPFQSMGAKGLPVATRPLPSVAFQTASGVHSHLCVGLDSALSLIHISEPTRRTPISYAVFC